MPLVKYVLPTTYFDFFTCMVSFYLLPARRRSVSSRIIFLIRRCFGVTSRYSSALMYSNASSREKITGGISFTLSSEPDARILVSFFDLVTFTMRSPSLAFSPTTCPAYTSSCGKMKNLPLSCSLSIEYAKAVPLSIAIIEPLLRRSISPFQGAYSRKR